MPRALGRPAAARAPGRGRPRRGLSRLGPGLQREVALKLMRAGRRGQPPARRGPHRRADPPSARRHGPRRRSPRRPRRAVDGARARLDPRAGGARARCRSMSPTPGGSAIEIGSALAAVHAAGLPPSRHQARERRARRRGPPRARRLRPRACAGTSPARKRRRAVGHADVHGARAARRGARLASGPTSTRSACCCGSRSRAGIRSTPTRSPSSSGRGQRGPRPRAARGATRRARRRSPRSSSGRSAPDPAERFASARALVEALEAWRPRRDRVARVRARAARGRRRRR